MLLFDVKNRCWSEEMLEICGINEGAAGTESLRAMRRLVTLLPEVAKELGVSRDC